MESVGQYGGIGIEIFVDINRELTPIDNRNLREIGDSIHSVLLSESIKNDESIKSQVKEEKDGVLSVFGDNAIYVEEIPNGYSNDEYFKMFPWFIITTKLGRIKIGWRKRVIEIDWSDSAIVFEADDIFPTEDTTKIGKLIHAWDYEQAKRYIDVLLT